MKGKSSIFSDTKNGWWGTPLSTGKFGPNSPHQLQKTAISNLYSLVPPQPLHLAKKFIYD